MSKSAETDPVFVLEHLDSYLDVLADLYDETPRACADRLPELNPPAPKRVKQDNTASYVLKEFVGPEYILCFDKLIELSSQSTESKKAKFFKLPKNEGSLSQFRFPDNLKSCYQKNPDVHVDEPDKENKKSPNQLKGKRRSKKTRYSLLHSELAVDDSREIVPQKPTDSDIHDLYKTIFPVRYIPFIYECQADGEKCATACSSRACNFQLFMEVKFNPGRPMPFFVRENLSKIQKEEGLVDPLSALIATSAVDSKPAVRRVFVPVSHDLGEQILGLNRKSSIASDYEVAQVDAEVARVVSDMLDFVVRQSEFVDFGYDPDISFDADKSEADEIKTAVSPVKRRRRKNRILRELGKLTNISITDESGEWDGEESHCSQPRCAFGCVCASINCKNYFQEHCRNFECMFECRCTVKYQFINEGELAKHEKNWHQTVVRKKNNDLEITGIERRKRATKFPAKFEDAVVDLEKDRRFKLGNKVAENSRRCGRKKYIDDEAKKLVVDPKSSARSSSMKQTLNSFNKILYEKRYSAVSGQEAKTLDVVFIWCSIHNKYDCYCYSWVSSTKTNNMILKPTRLNRFSGQKCMEQIDLLDKKCLSKQGLFYDRELNCARTRGSLMNYRKRNDTQIFRELHSRRLEADVLSYSNGYFKGSPVGTVETLEPRDDCPFSEMSGPSGVGEIVRIEQTEESALAEIDLDDHLSDDVYDDGEELHVSNLTIDLNDAMEYHPKPTRLKTQPNTFEPCFSLYTQKKKRIRPKIIDRPKIVVDESDSDVEIVEENCEIVSLSSEDEEVDDKKRGTTDVEVVSLDETAKVSDSTATGEIPILLNDEEDDVSSPTNDPPAAESCNAAKKAKIEIVTSKDVEMLAENIDKTSASFNVDVPDIVPERLPETEFTSSDTSASSAVTLSDDDSAPKDDYPDFGLFCMAHPEVGYFPVVACTDGSVGVTVEDPLNTKTLRIFKTFDDANNYIKGLIKVYYDPKFKFAPNAKFVKVTKGVLMKFKPEKFIDCIRKKTPTPQLKKRKAKSSLIPVQKIQINDEKIIKKPFELKSSHSSVAIDSKGSAEKQSLPTRDAGNVEGETNEKSSDAKKVVGTFKSMKDAAKFIENKYSTQVFLKPSTTTQPVVARSGMRLMSIRTEAGWRTVLMRGPVPASLVDKVRPMLVRTTTPTGTKTGPMCAISKPTLLTSSMKDLPTIVVNRSASALASAIGSKASSSPAQVVVGNSLAGARTVIVTSPQSSSLLNACKLAIVPSKPLTVISGMPVRAPKSDSTGNPNSAISAPESTPPSILPGARLLSAFFSTPATSTKLSSETIPIKRPRPVSPADKSAPIPDSSMTASTSTSISPKSDTR